MATQTSFSVYPNQLDSYGTLPVVKDGISEIRAADVNRLRDSILKIEQELGLQPSAEFSTVRARLDSISGADALIESHLVDTIDAHDASAISILDAGDNYVSTEVEGALGELASILPASLNVIGQNLTGVPNSGISTFVFQSGSTTLGTLHLFNTGAGTNDLKKTQPVSVTGINIIEVGEGNDVGVGAQLTFVSATSKLQWKAPGDSFGTAVDVSSLAEGAVVKLESSTSGKRIRVARTSVSLPTVNSTDTFDVLRFNGEVGAFSITSEGIKDSNNITRAAVSSTSVSRNQFMIGGFIFPADKGTLVLQKKLRLPSDVFAPIAVLDLAAAFDEDDRDTEQDVYSPTLVSFDSVTLFDRLPARKDYETLSTDSDNNQVYDNFNVSSTFSSFQVAKYLIPISNPEIITTGELESPTDITLAEINNKVAAFRLVHYIDGITDFNGEPAVANIFSISDALGAANDGDNNVRMSNVYIDTDISRPDVEATILSPKVDIESVPALVSGIHYYNSAADEFDLEVKSDTSLFSNAYLNSDILRLTSDALVFPSGDGYGDNVAVTRLRDGDGYSLYSSTNLPDFGSSLRDHGFYLLNSTYSSVFLTPKTITFSANAHVNAAFHDPFGTGSFFDAYGDLSSSRILVNTALGSKVIDSVTRTSNPAIEVFTNETFRIGTSEVFDFFLDAYQDLGGEVGTNGTLVNFNGTIPLSVGELQIGGRWATPDYTLPGLIFPQSDYSVSQIKPTQFTGETPTDYSDISFEVDSVYHRVFTLSQTINGARLRVGSSGESLISFSDINAGNSSRFMKIEVKIPGPAGNNNSTGFMDIGKLFETGQFDDGDGALAGAITGTAGDFIVPFTFGVRNTAESSDFIAVKVTYFGAEVATAKTKILSFLELLPST